MQRVGGKLYVAYNNTAQHMRDVGLFPTTNQRSSNQQTVTNHNMDMVHNLAPEITVDQAKFYKDWLRIHDTPWPTVENYWTLTCSTRRNDTVQQNAIELFEAWPKLKHSNAPRLVSTSLYIYVLSRSSISLTTISLTPLTSSNFTEILWQF
jgi:hypothetical protein